MQIICSPFHFCFLQRFNCMTMAWEITSKLKIIREVKQTEAITIYCLFRYKTKLLEIKPIVRFVLHITSVHYQNSIWRLVKLTNSWFSTIWCSNNVYGIGILNIINLEFSCDLSVYFIITNMDTIAQRPNTHEKAKDMEKGHNAHNNATTNQFHFQKRWQSKYIHRNKRKDISVRKPLSGL